MGNGTPSDSAEQALSRVSAGERLTPADVEELAAEADVLSLGMIADAVRRRLHGDRVTYLRVLSRPFDAPGDVAIDAAAREVRLTGSPPTLAAAAGALERARSIAGDRVVAGFSWEDVVRLAAGDGSTPARVLATLRGAGLEAVAAVSFDDAAAAAAAVDALAASGFRQLRVVCGGPLPGGRTRALLSAAALQERFGVIQALNPLVVGSAPARLSTGYDDMKAVALARIAAPGIPTIQVDWQRCGAKLAQVALTFGADDLDSVPAIDDEPHGRRRALLAEVRRNVEAAALVPVERDGRFRLIA